MGSDTRDQIRPAPAGRNPTPRRPGGMGLPAAAREAMAARIAARVDSALADAAAIAAELGDWDGVLADPADEPVFDDALLPLEFQLADLDRAVDSMLEARDRFLADGRDAAGPACEADPTAGRGVRRDR